MQPDLFIAGCHRSGSSWISKILAPSHNYVIRDEEIFNCASNIAKSPFVNMYQHICDENEAEFYQYVKSVVEKRYDFLGGMSKVRVPRDVARVVKRKYESIIRRLSPNRPQIFVEPIGLFSAEWFAKRFNSKVVIVVRHPASFVSSLKRLNWGFNFKHISEQEPLMESYLASFRKELENPPQRPDIIGMGILQWKMFYYVVNLYRKSHPEWTFVRHEDLASDPFTGFKKLYEQIGLPFSEESLRTIERYSSLDNPAEFSGRRDDSRRNSLATVKIWKARLTSEEVSRIRQGVEEVSQYFYDDNSWA